MVAVALANSDPSPERVVGDTVRLVKHQLEHCACACDVARNKLVTINE
jgi:hypothetical protein